MRQAFPEFLAPVKSERGFNRSQNCMEISRATRIQESSHLWIVVETRMLAFRILLHLKMTTLLDLLGTVFLKSQIL